MLVVQIEKHWPVTALYVSVALAAAAVLGHTMLGHPLAMFLAAPGAALFGAGAAGCLGLGGREAAILVPVATVTVLCALLSIR